MSDMKIPPDPGVRSSYSIPPEPPAKKSSLQSKAETSSSDSVKPDSPPNVKEGLVSPVEIPAPESANENTLMYLLTVLGNASFQIKQTLGISEISDLQNRTKMTELVVEQAGLMAKLSEQRSVSYLEIQQESYQAIQRLQTAFDATHEINKTQQENIDQINSGNSQEIQEILKLVEARETYVENLESIGATLQPDGTYLIPPDQIEEYNAFTAEYTEAVDEFNSYWNERLGQIESYNETVEAYNEKAAALNQTLSDFATTYHLEPFPKIPYIEPRDTSGYGDPVEAPPLLPVPPAPAEGEDPLPPVSVSVPALPSYVNEIARNGVPPVDNIVPYPITDAMIYHDAIFSKLYLEAILPFDRQLQSFSQFWSYLTTVTGYAKQNDGEIEPLLNDKPILFKLFEIIQEKKHVSELDSLERDLQLRERSVPDSMVDKYSRIMLGSEILKQIIRSDSVDISGEKLDRLTDRFLILSLGLLSSNGVAALLPSLSMIAPALASLPRNSPVFGILFSLSLTNRLHEHAASLTGTAIETLIKEIPELSSLTPEGKKKLEAGVSFGLLLTGGKLLESNLGLSGLIDRLLVSVFDPIPEANSFKTQDSERIDRLTDDFIRQGFPEDEAHFLSGLSIDLLHEGTLAPGVTSITPYSVNRTLLVDSLKAALILSKDHIPLTQADAIAHQAVNDTLAENPRLYAKQFRQALESNLRELGIQKNLSGIVQSVVLLPAPDPAFALQEGTQGEPELKDLIQKRVNRLLVPQIGTKLALEISDEINLTFFGNPNPGAAGKGNESWIDGIKRQIELLNDKGDREYAEKLSDAFAASVATGESLSLFLMNLMKPMQLMMHSIHSGTMNPAENKGKNLMI